jgi:NIPSNAP
MCRQTPGPPTSPNTGAYKLGVCPNYQGVRPEGVRPEVPDLIYELRIYDVIPGKLQTLHDRFAKTTVRIFERHGIKVVGFWTDAVGVSNRITYMVAFEDAVHRDQAWRATLGDPELVDAFADSEKDGPLIATMTNTILRPTPYSPLQ